MTQARGRVGRFSAGRALLQLRPDVKGSRSTIRSSSKTMSSSVTSTSRVMSRRSSVSGSSSNTAEVMFMLIAVKVRLGRQLGLSVQLPRRLTARLRDGQGPLEPAPVPGVVVRPDVVGRVRRGIPLRLRDARAQEAEPVPPVCHVPVVAAHLPHGLEVVQRRPGPRGGCAPADDVVVVRVAAAVGPHELAHHVGDVGGKVICGVLLESDGADGLRLPAVDEVADIVSLSLNGRDHGSVGDG